MTETKQSLARRTWLGGAATASAAAAAVVLLPSVSQPTVQAAAPSAEPAAEPGGYQLSEHVKQYYASARI